MGAASPHFQGKIGLFHTSRNHLQLYLLYDIECEHAIRGPQGLMPILALSPYPPIPWTPTTPWYILCTVLVTIPGAWAPSLMKFEFNQQYRPSQFPIPSTTHLPVDPQHPLQFWALFHGHDHVHCWKSWSLFTLTSIIYPHMNMYTWIQIVGMWVHKCFCICSYLINDNQGQIQDPNRRGRRPSSWFLKRPESVSVSASVSVFYQLQKVFCNHSSHIIEIWIVMEDLL